MEDGRVLVTHDRAFGDVVAVSVTEVFAAGPATADRFVEVRATIDGEFVSRDLARLTDARDALVDAVAWASDFAAGIRAREGSA